jgi:hypothetical protein
MIRYPWKEWFAPKRYKRPQSLVRGEDYFVQHYIMANMIRNKAVIEGVRVSIGIGTNGLVFTVTPKGRIGKKRVS